MPRDLRDVVNKIIVAVADDEPSPDEMANLSSDLATFFDASVVLLYIGRLPIAFTAAEGGATQSQVGPAISAMEERAQRTLDRMAQSMSSLGVKVTSRVVFSPGVHVIADLIESEKADLVVLPHWRSGMTERLIRVFSPSILEDATCPVLVLKGSKWLTKSRAERPGAAAPSP